MTSYSSTFGPVPGLTSRTFRGSNNTPQINPVVLSDKQSVDTFVERKSIPCFQGKTSSRPTNTDMKRAIRASLLTHEEEQRRSRSSSPSHRGRASFPPSTDLDLERALLASFESNKQEEENRSRSSSPSRRKRSPSPASTHSHPDNTSRSASKDKDMEAVLQQSLLTAELDGLKRKASANNGALSNKDASRFTELLTQTEPSSSTPSSSSSKERSPSPTSTHSHPSDTSRNGLENQNSSSQAQNWITRLGTYIGFIKSNPTGEIPGTPVSFDRLYGNNLKAIYIIQSLNHCFLYSALKSICHHPHGKDILTSIKINEDLENYYVKFPALKDFSTIPKTNLRNAVHSNSLGIQLIDLAYQELPNVKPGEYDSGITAFVRLFGEHQIINIDTSRTKVTDINGHNADLENITYHLGEAEIPHSSIADVIETTLSNPYHDDSHIVLVARPHDNRTHDAKNAKRYNFMANGHYLSFLDLNQKTKMATLGDSLGANERRVSLRELIKNYDLEGMMIPKILSSGS